MWYSIFRFVLIGPLLRLIARPVVSGLHHIPTSGPVIIAANHLAVIDSFVLCLVIERRLTFLAKQEYFTRPGLLGRAQRWFFTAARQVPVDRTGGDAATDALATAVQILRAGNAWAIHPEGTRSPDGHLHRGRTGVIRVAMITGAPVIPVGLTGTDRIGPHRRVRVAVGAPIQPSGNDARADTNHLMRTIQELSGQTYIDSYAQRPTTQ